jgi:hypothetical protein
MSMARHKVGRPWPLSAPGPFRPRPPDGGSWVVCPQGGAGATPRGLSRESGPGPRLRPRMSRACGSRCLCGLDSRSERPLTSPKTGPARLFSRTGHSPKRRRASALQAPRRRARPIPPIGRAPRRTRSASDLAPFPAATLPASRRWTGRTASSGRARTTVSPTTTPTPGPEPSCAPAPPSWSSGPRRPTATPTRPLRATSTASSPRWTGSTPWTGTPTKRRGARPSRSSFLTSLTRYPPARLPSQFSSA